MSDKKNISVNGISSISILGLIFITLKLTGHITWSWWLVTLPFTFVPIAIIFCVIMFFIAAIIVAIIDEILK
ncbi:MAG: hypothetical protein GY849_21565 [Deltaproteobacteria bacterium]|nr:hypothetical protein [Deltaproteobacteria bacterium]